MSDFQGYMLAQEKARAAKKNADHASAALDNARVMERLAEIKSQHEPLNGLMESDMPERDKLYSVAFYVAVGRWPCV